MMKFFRKYNRQLLAVFMALLLLVWLGGSALTTMLSAKPQEFVRATSKAGDIKQIDFDIAEFETERLRDVGLNWQHPWMGDPPAVHEPLELIDWILLTREARQWGMEARQVEVDQFLTALGLTPDHLHVLANRMDVSAERIYAAIANYIGVWRTLRLTVGRTGVSEAKIRVAARDEGEKLQIRAVPVRAGSYLDAAETFTEEEIQAHFGKYREQKPVSGIAFGYSLPPQVRVQHFRVDPQELAKHLRVREATLDDRAKEYWRMNRQSDVFRRPAKPVDAEGGPPTDPFTAPFFESYEEARDIALTQVRFELAKVEATNIAAWLMEQLHDPWFGQTAGTDGYKPAPPDVLKEEYYEQLKGRVPANLTYGNAIEVFTSDFVTVDNLVTLTDIGVSAHEAGTRRINFRNVAAQVQGIEAIPTDTGVDSSFYLALGQTSPVVLFNARGQAFLYRILAVKPAGPAESLDLVRDKVIEDMHLLKGFERAREAAEKLLMNAQAMGLESGFATMKDELEATPFPTQLHTPLPFGRIKTGSAGKRGDNHLTDMGAVGVISGDFVERCFALENDPNPFKVTSIEVPTGAKFVIVEFVERVPVRADAYAGQRPQVVRNFNEAEVGGSLSEWLDPTRIRDRNGLVWSGS
ncbi:MAG: hypothetical protein HOP29_15985 [Phycisphaerales bacterium]|nr:hypothetical protein [Phycisphaerales bacterium]